MAATYDGLKTRLYRSFLDSRERGLTDEQSRLAKDSVEQGRTLWLSEKYKLIRLSSLIRQNNVRVGVAIVGVANSYEGSETVYSKQIPSKAFCSFL